MREALTHLKAITEAFGPGEGIELDQKAWSKLHSAIKEALAQPEQEPDEVDIRSRLYQRIHELETQLALPEQEPVRIMGFDCVCGRRMEVSAEQGVEPSPQRTWVGLTHSDIDQGLLRSDYAFKTAEAWRAGVVFAMTKLKEKNT